MRSCSVGGCAEDDASGGNCDVVDFIGSAAAESRDDVLVIEEAVGGVVLLEVLGEESAEEEESDEVGDSPSSSNADRPTPEGELSLAREGGIKCRSSIPACLALIGPDIVRVPDDDGAPGREPAAFATLS